jgi:hypothetical protein
LVAQIEADGERIPDIPINVQEQPGARYLGPARITGQVNKPVTLKMDAINCKPNDLDVCTCAIGIGDSEFL